MYIKYTILLVVVFTDLVTSRSRRAADFIPGDVFTTSARSCNSFQQPQKPNFDKYDYRVCERKCLDYLWEMNNRIEERKHLQQCSGASAVIRGDDVKPAEYPHMGAVGWRVKGNSWRFLCGSSLISPKFVLTAAHCTRFIDPDLESSEPSIVRLGTTNILNPPDFPPTIDVNIKNIIVHPRFEPPYKYNDIALFELDRELKFNKFLQPACLWGKRRVDNIQEVITVTGWGATVEEPSAQTVLNDKLKVVEVSIVKTKTCDKLLESFHSRNWWGVDHQICAGNIGSPSDSCNGDSGGPLQFIIINSTDEGQMSMIIGVTTFGVYADKCGQLYTPGIYTKVYSFLHWIERHVWANEH